MRSVVLFASLGLVLFAGCSSGSSDSSSSSSGAGAGGTGTGGGSPSGGCEAVRVCCAALVGTSAMACKQAADSAEGSGSPTQACAALFSAYQQSGMCGGSAAGGAGGAVGAGGASTVGGFGGGVPQPAICARFVSCSTKAAPGSAAAVIAAYGPAGTCWNTTPGVAMDCTAACKTGIAQLHGADAKDCPVCLADTECSGVTPACDTSKGSCVGCTTDAHCPGGACDTSVGACVQCTSNAQCTSPSAAVCDNTSHKCVPGCTSDAYCTSASQPHCDLATHGCVQCTNDSQCAGSPNGPSCLGFTDKKCGCFSDFQCPSLSCSPDTGTCCTPKACPAGVCGMIDNGCGQKIDCGGCSKGFCQSGQCDATGLACDPAANDCPSKERCLYDDKKYAYVCTPDEEGMQCLYTDDCKFLGGNKVNTYFCLSGGGLGKCTPYCLVPTDCAAAKKCTMFGSPIGPMSPGICI